jgi:hypothetical protein
MFIASFNKSLVKQIAAYEAKGVPHEGFIIAFDFRLVRSSGRWIMTIPVLATE